MEVDDFKSAWAEDTSDWLQAIEGYVKKTEATRLNLRTTPGKIDHYISPQTSGLLQFLENSQITELHLIDHNLRYRMEQWSELLRKTKVTHLNIKFCDLTAEDLLILMAALKDTQITSLDVSMNEISLENEKLDEFVAHLKNSRLVSLNFASNALASPYQSLDFFEVLSSTNITQLDLTSVLNPNARSFEWNPTTHTSAYDRFIEADPLPEPVSCLSVLLFNLRHTAIKSLNLSLNLIDNTQMKILGENLSSSKLEKLDLSSNYFDDVGVDFLVAGLVNSKIRELNLSKNSIRGDNSLGQNLANTQLTILDLSENRISNGRIFSPNRFLESSNIVALTVRKCDLNGDIGFALIEELKFSKVTYLDLSCNKLESQGDALIDLIRHSAITHIDLRVNCFRDTFFTNLGDCLKESRLKNINLSANWYHAGERDMALAFAYFLNQTKDSSIHSIHMSANCLGLGPQSVAMIAENLADTTFTSLDFSANTLATDFVKLVSQLEFTAITHLNLSNNRLTDKDINSLANCLKKTQIRDLNVSSNFITSLGAKAVALALKKSKILRLNLEGNNIENDGIEALAECAENTLITVLNIANNSGKRRLLIETVLWKNRTQVQLLVDILRRIVVETDGKLILDLDHGFDNDDVELYIEKCLRLYQKMPESLWAIVDAIEDDESLRLDKQAVSLVLEDFPREFAAFVGKRVEPDVTQNVSFLRRMEEEGFAEIVELLLYNRHEYVIDEDKYILHPYVYVMLHKYNKLICNFNLEPERKAQLVSYFVKHSNLDGASEVIALLNDEKVS